jgi:BTB And C-terminal Kelch
MIPQKYCTDSFQIEAYEAVISWVKSNVTENCRYLPLLLSRLRLSQLPASYLIDTVCAEELIRQNTACRDYIDEAKHYQMSLAQIVPNVPVTERILPRKSFAGSFKTCNVA